MKKILSNNKIPIKLWLEDIDESALAQAENLANLPFAFKYIAIMPDSHVGYGMPIGAVLATNYVIIPNAIGVDIGCGMYTVRTSLQEISTNALKKIMGLIRKVVPLGFEHHKSPQGDDGYVWVMIHSGSRNIGYSSAGSSLRATASGRTRGYSCYPKQKGSG